MTKLLYRAEVCHPRCTQQLSVPSRSGEARRGCNRAMRSSPLGCLRSVSKHVGRHENPRGRGAGCDTRVLQILQTVLFGLCTLIDAVHMFLPTRQRSISRLLPLKDFIFSVLVFPVGLFVAITFWTLYAYDRELVYPKELDEVNPSWLNHTMHTTILPLLLIELVSCPHKYPHKLKGIIGLSIFGSSYLTWIIWVNHASGIWVYPILEVLGRAGKALLFFTCYLEMVGFYFLGDKLTKLLWGETHKHKK
ncbi:androgen-induced gene 1 protein-like [Alligator sinensis]|uniref:Androgen-induced gene 1 protein-like n=1 Tax=Alligator sinensis TaxID=38654 RepID=A0A1U7RIT8_ALLSI|nr:androgen-induced gene 1 protein-like [Alligator sinensis]